MASLQIAIIGAGPVGCTLARILSVSVPSVSVTIYESDSSPNFRSQGGTLDLHPKSGLAAIREAKLEEQFRKFARLDGDYVLMCDKDLKTLLTFGPSGKGNLERPEIDRSDLRKILAESLPEGTIKWGHHLARLEPDGETRKTLIFKDGSTATGFDLVVGAEGAWSKVRTFITDIKPYYSGIAYHTFSIPDPKTKAPGLHKLVNGGNVFASNTHQKLSVQQMGDGSLHVGYSMVRPESWQDPASEDWCVYDVHDLEATRHDILKATADWDPRLREAILKVQGKVDTRNLYMLPADFTWEHKAGVTLIGDAAHVMTPFAGEGVNVGLNDARHLAAAIKRSVETGSSLEAEVEKAEKAMFPRMNKFQKLTESLMNLWMFSDDVHTVIPKVVMEHVTLDLPWLLHPLLWVGVNGWWAAKSLKESIIG
ncbi:monooxygenase FAD-binding protein [Seiridium cupressi]